MYLAVGGLTAQDSSIATTWKERQTGYEVRKQISGNHILKNLQFTSIGPTIMGGRVTDLAVSPADPSFFYVAYASGGLWLTSNSGQSYTPLFDHEMVMSIGDIAVNWYSGEIWVGTGENNSSRSSYSGFGIYHSSDTGKSWEHMGLPESHHIGRIILHPSDPNILWVAVIGHLYSANAERGVYRSEDGGKTWEKVLYIDQNTGAIDLVLDPDNPKNLYASMWCRERTAWNFVEGGKTSGIFKSHDGGKSWSRISGGTSGFPEGEGVGRIGLAISHGTDKRIYALLDNQFRRAEKKGKEPGLDKDEFREMSKEQFMDISDDELKKWLKKNGFPEKYSVDTVRQLIKNEEIKPVSLAEYLEDANRDLFETEVKGAEVYVSMDDGITWKRTHENPLDDLVYTYGYYFGLIRVSPIDANKIYIAGVPIVKSDDGGKTFKSINGENQHVDHHALWINPEKAGYLINGNDGGMNISMDDGENWQKVNSPPVGQFYTVNVDFENPYNVYGGLQDNGVWKGPSTYKQGVGWQYLGHYPYTHLLGGDGFKVEIDRRDKTVFTGFQFGHYYRINPGGKRHKITPRHELGERPFRFNWHTPIWLSRHNQHILYFGSNHFHRSLDRGNTYDLKSVDMTKGGLKGDVSYGTITHIHESPLKFGMIYLGTDDGLVYRSDDIGYTWNDLKAGLPEDMWVTCIQASSHDTNRVFLALNGYRRDDFRALVYLSEDQGRNWKFIGDGFPLEPVNVIREDPRNENLIYIGTDHGVYVSLDRGKNYLSLGTELPAVAVHDLVIHSRDRDLVLGTHGRSLYKMNIEHLQKLTNEVMVKGIHLFDPPSLMYNPNWGKQWNAWKEANIPECSLAVYVKKMGEYRFEVYSEEGLELHQRTIRLDAGLNYMIYDLSIDEDKIKSFQKSLEKQKKKVELSKSDNQKYYLPPGTYTVKLSDKSLQESRKLKIKERGN